MNQYVLTLLLPTIACMGSAFHTEAPGTTTETEESISIRTETTTPTRTDTPSDGGGEDKFDHEGLGAYARRSPGLMRWSPTIDFSQYRTNQEVPAAPAVAASSVQSALVAPQPLRPATNGHEFGQKPHGLLRLFKRRYRTNQPQTQEPQTNGKSALHKKRVEETGH